MSAAAVGELLFPVGHYLGPQYRPGQPEPAGHRVRVGTSLRWLGSEPELLAWTLSHGPDTAWDDRPWSRSAVLEHGWALAGLDLAEPVASLLDRGLLVETDPSGRDAPGFARAYRLRPLLLHLGPEPSEPDSILLGTAGEPVVALSGFGYAVWRAGQVTTTLWEICQAVAGAEPTATEPTGLLPELLSELHGLLGAGAAYLDDPAEEGIRDAGVTVY